jgi:hypothetical protein
MFVCGVQMHCALCNCGAMEPFNSFCLSMHGVCTLPPSEECSWSHDPADILVGGMEMPLGAQPFISVHWRGYLHSLLSARAALQYQGIFSVLSAYSIHVAGVNPSHNRIIEAGHMCTYLALPRSGATAVSSDLITARLCMPDGKTSGRQPPLWGSSRSCEVAVGKQDVAAG